MLCRLHFAYRMCGLCNPWCASWISLKKSRYIVIFLIVRFSFIWSIYSIQPGCIWYWLLDAYVCKNIFTISKKCPYLGIFYFAVCSRRYCYSVDVGLQYKHEEVYTCHCCPIWVGLGNLSIARHIDKWTGQAWANMNHRLHVETIPLNHYSVIMGKLAGHVQDMV